MQFRAWMYDIARDQSPNPAQLSRWMDRSERAGYNAVGFYVEHRLEYPSAPWAFGPGGITQKMVRDVVAEFPNLRIIPFLNTLGHMEGFIRAEGGQWLAEGPAAWSVQMCPSRPECVAFARNLVSDAMDCFSDEWVHLGGDETWQLGQCALCKPRAEKIGKAGIYAEYFGELCRWVLECGRRPCLWGDMLLEHPEAMAQIPKETVIFDWHYDSRPYDSAKMFRGNGFDVVCCPALRSYDSHWCHLDESVGTIHTHVADAAATDSLGVCMTTWELSFLTTYYSIMPLVYKMGADLSSKNMWEGFYKSEEEGDYYQNIDRAAEILSSGVTAISNYLHDSQWRRLRMALIYHGNPFYLWQDWRDEACGRIGDKLLELTRKCDEFHIKELRFPTALLRESILWVRAVEAAYQSYKVGFAKRSGQMILKAAASAKKNLMQELKKIPAGEFAPPDVERLDIAFSYAMQKAREIAKFHGTTDEYRPAFETLIRPEFIPGAQAGWLTGGER